MSDGTKIDTLSLEIEADAAKAIKGIDALSGSLENLGKVVGKSKFNGAIGKKMIDSAAVERELDRLHDKFASIGTDFKPTGSLVAMQRQLSQVESKLSSLAEKEEKAMNLGRVNGLDSLVYDFSMASNKADALREAIEKAKSAASSFSDLDFPTSDPFSGIEQPQNQIVFEKDAYEGRDIAAEIEQATSDMFAFNSALEAAHEKYRSLGSEWSFAGNLQQTQSLADRLQQKLENLFVAQDKAVMSGSTRAFDGVAAKIEETANKLEILREREAELTAQEGQLEAQTSKTATAFSLLGKFSNLASVSTKSLFSGFSKLIPSFNHAHNSHRSFVGSLNAGFMTALKYGLGIRSLFVLFNKLRSAMVAGFGNLSQYSADTKSNLDSLSTGLSSLQNALAVAFNPILEVVTPILSTLIDYAIAAANAIAMLFAVLSGGGTYIKAKRIASGMGAIGGAAGGAGGAVKELKRELLGFDEITKLQDDSSGGGGGGGGGAGGIGDMFDTEEISADMKNFAEKLKDAWKSADFTEIGEIIGTKLKEGLDKIPWDTIQSYAERIGKSFATFINGAIEVEGLDTSVGATIGEALNTALSLASGFVSNLHFDSIGNFISGSINEAMSRINWETAFDISESVGSGIASVINKVATPETFNNIGSTIANALNTEIKGLKKLGEDIEWKQVGDSIASGLNTFISDFNWKDAGLTFNEWTKGMLDTIITAVKDTDFVSLGEGIASAIKGIDWEGILKSAGSLVGETFLSLITLGTTISDRLFADDIGNYVLDVQKITKALSEANEELQTRIKEAEGWSDAGIEYEYAHKLADEYFNLHEKQNKSNEEKEKEKQLASELKTLFPELEQFYNGETGLLDATRESVMKYIDSLQQKAKQEAATEALKKLYESQMNASIAMQQTSETIDGLKGRQKALTDEQTELNRLIALGEAGVHGYSDKLESNYKQLDKNRENLAEVNKALGEAQTEYDNTQKTIEDAGKQIDIINGYLTTTGELSATTADAFTTLSEKMSELPKDQQIKIQAILDDDSLSFDDKRIQVLAELTGIDQETLRKDQRKVDELWGNLEEVIDKTNGKAEVDNVNAKITKSIDELTGDQKTIETLAEYASSDKGHLTKEQKTIDTWSNYVYSARGQLTKEQRTIPTWANYIYTAKGKLTKSQRTISAWANYTSAIKSNLSSANKTISTTSKYTSSDKSGLDSSAKTIPTTAKYVEGQDFIPPEQKVIRVVTRRVGQGATGGIYVNGRWSPITAHANGGVLVNGVWKDIPQFANGGILGTTGQVFIAREAGPELVGNLNGHTAVMNNNQIVASVSDGVAKGVYRAMVAAGSGNRNVTVNVSLEGDARGIFRVVQRENNKIVQSTGRPALLI